MRSHALQACRPLRTTSSVRLQCLVQPSFSASLRTNAPSSAPATSSSAPKPAYSPRTKAVPARSAQPYKGPIAKAPDSRSPQSNGVLDPQVAVPAGPTVEEVDPSLTSQIPTPSNTPSAFVAGLQRNSAVASLGGGVAAEENGNGNGNGTPIDWSSSFHGLSTTAFSPEAATILMAPIDPDDIEIKPDGIVYLPEIKYRRILNQAFGPGGWGLAPRGDMVVGEKVVTREYALVVNGRFVAQARGECAYFSEDTIPTALEGCKSNALMRCCKDLGVASELWDPRFLRKFKKEYGHEVWVEHIVSKKRRQVWKRKDCDPAYPFQATTSNR